MKVIEPKSEGPVWLIRGCRRASQGFHAGRGAASQRHETACVHPSALPVPCLLGDAALAQLVLLHLSAFGGRQLAHEFQISRNREIG